MEVDRQSEDLAKIINFIKTDIKTNKKGATSTSVNSIRKHLKIKAKARRIEFNNCMKLALKNGDLEQVTGTGAYHGSFRIPKDNKKKVAKKSDESQE